MASCWLLGILTSDPDKFGTQYTMLEWIWSKLLMCQCQACLLVSATILVSASKCQLSKGTDTVSATQEYKDEDSSRQAHALAGTRCLGKLTHSQEHAQCVNLPTCAGPHAGTHTCTRVHTTRCAALCACLSHGSAMCCPAGRNQEHISSRMVGGKQSRPAPALQHLVLSQGRLRKRVMFGLARACDRP
jgi:hypothetical protein